MECPDGTVIEGLDIGFSASEIEGSSDTDGQFSIRDRPETLISKNGEATDLQLDSEAQSYVMTATETNDSLCRATAVPTTVTISGSCGTGVTVNFNADNGETGTFVTDVTCSRTIETPAEAVDDLISDVGNLEGVPQGTRTSLTAPLQEVSDILNDDNPENDSSACNRLNAFISEVNAAERRDDITEDQADDLRTQAEDIRSELEC